MKTRFFVILFAALAVLNSCEWEPMGVYNNEVDLNVTPPEIEIIDLDLLLEEDTVDIYYRDLYFNFKSTNQKIQWINFYMDGSLIGTVNNLNGVFRLEANNLFIGYHTLRIELFTHSGTGSIADQVGVEGYLFSSKEWTVKVHNNQSYKVTSTVSDGFLKLRFQNESSSQYAIFRSGIEIGKTTNNWFVDKSYVGEGAQYSVYTVSSSGTLSSFGNVTVPKIMPTLKFDSDKSNNYFLKWDKPRYYAAIDTVLLIGRSQYSYNINYVYKISNPEQTSCQIYEPFGTFKSYWIVVKPKYPISTYTYSTSPNQNYSSNILECKVGNPSPIFISFYGISSTEFVYHANKYDYNGYSENDSIFRYSVIDNGIVDRFRYGFGNPSSGNNLENVNLSPEGSYLVARIGATKNVFVSSGFNFTNYKIVDISGLLTNSLSFKVCMSNIGTGLVYGNYSKKYIYDFENEVVIGSVNFSSDYSRYNISPDGKYFFLSNGNDLELYSIDNNTISLIANVGYGNPLDNDYFAFFSNQANKAIGWNKTTKVFNILKLPELEVQSTFLVNEDEILDIDFRNNQILSFSPNLLVVRSLINGSIQYEVPFGYSYYWHNKCYIHGNSIFYENGLRYYLNSNK